MNGTSEIDLEQEIEQINRYTALCIIGSVVALGVIIALVASSDKDKVMSVTDVMGKLQGF